MKKGFTLVEVLAIIAVLGVMAVLVFPKIGGSIESKKERELNKIIGIVENAGKFYHSFNDDQYKISIDTLINEKYVTSDLIDPNTGEKLNGCVRVIKNSDGFLNYKYTSCDNISIPFTAELNGGVGQKFENSYNDSTIINLIEPTKENSEFNGWEVVKGNSILKGDKLIIGTEETIIHAKWDSYPSLTVKLNDGTTPQKFEETYKTGTTIKLETPTKEGYLFTGWTVSGGLLSGNRLTFGENDVTITANFSPLVVQAIYSETDNSLMFINDRQYSIGETYNGKTVTAVYTGFTTTYYTETAIPWYSHIGV